MINLTVLTADREVGLSTLGLKYVAFRELTREDNRVDLGDLGIKQRKLSEPSVYSKKENTSVTIQHEAA